MGVCLFFVIESFVICRKVPMSTISHPSTSRFSWLAQVEIYSYCWFEPQVFVGLQSSEVTICLPFKLPAIVFAFSHPSFCIAQGLRCLCFEGLVEVWPVSLPHCLQSHFLQFPCGHESTARSFICLFVASFFGSVSELLKNFPARPFRYLPCIARYAEVV